MPTLVKRKTPLKNGGTLSLTTPSCVMVRLPKKATDHVDAVIF
jgi:hypothetical protein